MKILIVNHKEKECGVQQYGKRFGQILEKSVLHVFDYFECSDLNSFINKVLDGKYYSIVDIGNIIYVSSKLLNLYEKKCKIQAMTKNYFVVSYDIPLENITKYLTIGIEDIKFGEISVKKTTF
jgi:hypothetical protein